MTSRCQRTRRSRCPTHLAPHRSYAHILLRVPRRHAGTRIDHANDSKGNVHDYHSSGAENDEFDRPTLRPDGPRRDDPGVQKVLGDGADMYVDGVVINVDDAGDTVHGLANVCVQGHANCAAPLSMSKGSRVLDDVLVALVMDVESLETFVRNDDGTLVDSTGGTVVAGACIHRMHARLRLHVCCTSRVQKDWDLRARTLHCWRVARVTDTAAYKQTTQRPFQDAVHLFHVDVAVREVSTAHYATRSTFDAQFPWAYGRRSAVSPLDLSMDDDWKTQVQKA